MEIRITDSTWQMCREKFKSDFSKGFLNLIDKRIKTRKKEVGESTSNYVFQITMDNLMEISAKMKKKVSETEIISSFIVFIQKMNTKDETITA